MKGRERPKKEPAEVERTLQNKLLSLKPEAVRAFDILKAEQGPRSGPRLAAEAIDLLLVKYGKPPIGFP
jgi:hypothetical protein